MAITVTNKLDSLKTLFNSVKEIYYKSKALASADLGGASLTMDMELPVLEDGVSVNTGDADVTNIKITTGATWTTKAVKGDPDISFQVASVDGVINDLLLNKVDAAAVASATALLDGVTYEGSGYSLAPKKVTGSLVMFSEDRQTIIILPNVEIYSSLVAADGDNPAYFNVSVTPVENSEGADIFILRKKVTAQGGSSDSGRGIEGI